MPATKKDIFFKLKWLVSTAAIFAFMVTTLSSIGFVPETAKTEASENEPEKVQVVVTDALPTRIIIDRLGVNSAIVNPASRSIETLDQALMNGVVRYPGSADLDDEGNMFLFGHSSGRPVIYNPAFKVFNQIGTLVEGDVIRIESKTDENVYRVVSVRFADASEISVPLATPGKHLTISTCDSFGGKSDRVIVDAVYVGTFPLSAPQS